MDEEIIYGLAEMIFVIIFGVAIILAITKITQTKLQTEKEEAYQKLADDSTEFQQETARLNTKLADDLSEIKERVKSIDRMLKEVE